MRISSLLTLVIAVVFLLTPSINNGLWDWYWTAPVLTKIRSTLLAFSIGAILVRCTWDKRLQEVQKRTWRNVAFVASGCAIALVMFGMVLIGTLTPVPDWMRSIGFVAFFTALIARVLAHLSTDDDAMVESQSMN